MLRILRKKMRGILIATMVIIIPTFIFFYGASRYRGKGRPTVVIAKVNGQRITYPQLYNVSRRIKESRRAISGGQGNNETEKQINTEALEQLIKKILLRQEAKRRRIRVSDKELLREIESYPYFQKEGLFNQNLYLRLLKVNRISPEQFEERVRNDLRTRKLLRQIVGGVTISDEELKKAYLRMNEKVRVKYILFKTEKFKKDITVSKEEVEKYFQRHRVELKIPEKINAKYAMIGFKPQEMKVEEKEIINYYRKHLDRYKKEGNEKLTSKESSSVPSKEARAEIRGILANRKAEEKAREEAENLAANLFDKSAWKIMIKKHKLKVKETGFFARGEAIKGIGWAPGFIEQAFSLKEDEVSDAVQTPKGYAIFIIKERSKAHLPQLEEVKDKVTDRVREEKARELAREKAEECLRKLKKGNGFQETAKEFSLKVKDSGLFSRGGYIDGIGPSSSFAEAAFSLRKGELSPVIEVSRGFVILKEEEKKGIDKKKYASEAEIFRKSLLPRKQMEVYNQWYRALREKAKVWIAPDFKDKVVKVKW